MRQGVRDVPKVFVSGCAHIASILLNLKNSLKVPQTHDKSFLVKSWSQRSWAGGGPPPVTVQIAISAIFGKTLVFWGDFATNQLSMTFPNRSSGKTGQNASEKSLHLTSFLVMASWPALLLG